VNVWRRGEREIESEREWPGKGERFFSYMKGPPETNVGGREGLDRQRMRMYGEARRKANQKAFAVSNHKIPRSARGKRTKGKRD
jgi:hypothetical protein